MHFSNEPNCDRAGKGAFVRCREVYQRWMGHLRAFSAGREDACCEDLSLDRQRMDRPPWSPLNYVQRTCQLFCSWLSCQRQKKGLRRSGSSTLICSPKISTFWDSMVEQLPVDRREKITANRISEITKQNHSPTLDTTRLAIVKLAWPLLWAVQKPNEINPNALRE